MKQPVVSVVMPVYNGEKYLRAAMDSILTQTYTDFEFIILDDGSTDSSREIVLSYDDPRIRFCVNEKNLGIAATLNRGVALAQGKYIARMDSDDIAFPQRFEKQVAYLDSHPEVAVCGTWIDCFGTEQGVHHFASDPAQMKVDMFFANGLVHPSVMMRKSLFDTDGLYYNDRFSKMEDYALWLQVIKKHTVISMPEPLLRYRIHPDQVSGSYNEIAAEQALALMKEKVEDLGICAEEEGVFLLAQNGRKIYTAEETAVLLAFLKKLYRANRAAQLYDPKLFRASLHSVQYAALSRFSGKEAAEIVRTAGNSALCYRVNRSVKQSASWIKRTVKNLVLK